MKTQTLARPTLGDRLIWFIFWRRRLARLWFPSKAEIAFIRLMRGHVLVLPVRSWKTHSNFCIVRRGRLLKGELLEREVRVGRYYADMATPNASYKKILEVDGERYHDVLKDQERDAYLQARGWQVLRIPARRVFREPLRVRRDVLKFLRT